MPWASDDVEANPVGLWVPVRVVSSAGRGVRAYAGCRRSRIRHDPPTHNHVNRLPCSGSSVELIRHRPGVAGLSPVRCATYSWVELKRILSLSLKSPGFRFFVLVFVKWLNIKCDQNWRPFCDQKFWLDLLQGGWHKAVVENTKPSENQKLATTTR